MGALGFPKNRTIFCLFCDETLNSGMRLPGAVAAVSHRNAWTSMGPICVICCCFLPVVPECYKRKLKPHDGTRRHKDRDRFISAAMRRRRRFMASCTRIRRGAFSSSRTLIRNFPFGCVDAGPRRSITSNVRGRPLL